MKAEVLDWAAIRAAARRLEQGQLVAFPTETVYGLGADAENPAAIAAIYAAKGRPSNHPVIVHLAPEAELGYWAAELAPEALRLVQAFWPGPLTLIVKRAAHVPAAVAGGQDTVGLRCPSHPVAQALLREFRQGKGGLAAPSANRFGHVSPTTAQHVRAEFPLGGAVDCILDGGQSEVGIESTILDLSRLDTAGPVLLRPGQISAERIAEVIGILPRRPDAAAPRASGTLAAHYAPGTALALVPWAELAPALQGLAAAGRKAALMYWSAADGLPLHGLQASLRLPAEAAGYAHGLYDGLRRLDLAGADIILVEQPPQEPAWSGINDRLRRAAYDSAGQLEGLMEGS